MLLRGINDDRAVPLLQFCLAEGYHLRFIEQMPLDAQHGWNRGEMVTAAEILDDARRRFTLTPARSPGAARPPSAGWSTAGPATSA